MKLSELVKLHKANNAAGLSVNSTLTPGQAIALVSAMVSINQFMQEITTHKAKKLKTPMPVLTITSRNLTRVAEGTDANGTTPVTGQSSNVGKMLDLSNVDMFYDLLFSVIDDNGENPDFVKTIEKNISDALGNDLLDLATNGTADTYVKDYNASTNPVPMYTLCKGWITLAKASSNVNKVNSHSDSDLMVTMKKMVSALPSKWKNPAKVKFIMSPADKETYLSLIGGKDSTAAILQDGQTRGYLGYAITVNPYLPTGTILLTDPQNLVMAINIADIQKDIEKRPRKKAYEYTYTAPVDFEICIDEALVIGYDQGA